MDAVVERLRACLPAELAVSVGSAQLPDEGTAPEQLVVAADRRLYSDKVARAA